MEKQKCTSFSPVLYKRRWFVLAAHCFVTISNSSSWYAFSAISNIIQKYYNINLVKVNWLAIAFNLVAVIMMFLTHRMLETKGLKNTMVLSGFFNALGSCTRYMGYMTSYGYWFLLAGSILCAVSSSSILFLPSNIAAVWFGENERATATSIAIAADSLGIALSYFLSTSIVENKPSLQQIGNELGIFLLIEALQGLFAFIFICFAVQDQPKTPPSYSEALKRNEANSLLDSSEDESEHELTQFLSSVKKKLSQKESGYLDLAKNAYFIIVLTIHGITFGLEAVFLVTLNEILLPRFPGYEHEIGWMGTIGLLLSIPANCIVGMVLDRTGEFKCMTIASIGFCCLSTAFLSTFLYFNASFYAFFFTYLVLASISSSYDTTAFDHCAELAYPVSEAKSGLTLMWIAQCYCLLFGEVASRILQYSGGQLMLISILVLYIFILILSLFLKNQGPRTTAYDDAKNEDNNNL